MLRVTCPIDGTVHHADEIHAGKMLRCATCGRPVQIGPSAESSQLSNLRDGAGGSHAWPGWLSAVRERTSAIPARFRFRNKFSLLSLGTLCACGCIFLARYYLGQPTREAPASGAPVAEQSEANNVGFRAAVSSPGMVQESTVDQHATSGSIFAPPAHVVPSAVPEQDRRLPSGTRISPDSGPAGRGQLTIDNSSGQDSVVKVVSLEEGRLVRHVFVQRGATVNLSHLHEGDYKVLFAVGEDWDRARFRFTRYQGFFEFGKSLDFTETELSNGVEYSHHSITLYTTPLGNVKREVISEAEFDAH